MACSPKFVAALAIVVVVLLDLFADVVDSFE
jgi:hypothetical protein